MDSERMHIQRTACHNSKGQMFLLIVPADTAHWAVRSHVYTRSASVLTFVCFQSANVRIPAYGPFRVTDLVQTLLLLWRLEASEVALGKQNTTPILEPTWT